MAAAGAACAATLPGDTRGLWQGRGPAKPSVSSPRFVWVGRDLRLFRGAAPDAEVLLPFCVVEDGNPEDGFGGYVIGLEKGPFYVRTSASTVELRGEPIAAPAVP